MDINDISIALAKLQVTQELILSEIKELKPRVSWLETKYYYGIGFLGAIALMSDKLLKALGFK